MGYHTMNLHTFNIDKWSMDLLQFFNLDSDYNGVNGDEYWELSDLDGADGEPIPLCIVQGFKTEAERLLNKWDDPEADDHSRIGNILDKIGEFCHGSYSVSFTYEIEDIEGGYVVAVSYLT